MQLWFLLWSPALVSRMFWSLSLKWNFGRAIINHWCVCILCAFICSCLIWARSKVKQSWQVKRKPLFSLVFRWQCKHAHVRPHKTAAGPSCGSPSNDNIKPPFWKFLAPENDPSRRHCSLVNLGFCTSISLLCLSVAVNENYANGDGHSEEKMLTSLVLAAPKHTHTHLTHPIQAAFYWPASVALSLLAVSQAHFNNRGHTTRTPSCLLSGLGHFIQTEQVHGQIDGMLPSVEANSLGLFNFGKSQWRRFALKKSQLWLAAFDEATCSRI